MHQERIAGQGRVMLYSYQDLMFIAEGSRFKIAVGLVDHPRKKEIVKVSFKGFDGDMVVFQMEGLGNHEFKFPKSKDVILLSKGEFSMRKSAGLL